MRILIVTQYFWPENFRINDLCLGLSERGHEVSVLTGKPNYPKGSFYKGYSFFRNSDELWEGIKIYRSILFTRGNGNGIRLLFNYISFAFFASFRLLFINKKFDKIIVYQLSPATIGIPGIIAKLKFKAPVYFYIQDLWPESLRDAGGINNKIILKIVDKMMNYFYRKASLILVQSPAFTNYLISKGVPENKIEHLPNTVETFYRPQNKDIKYLSNFPKGFNIVFAGNIGEAQDFNTIIETAKILKNKNLNINWIIIGEGRGKGQAILKVKSLLLTECFKFIGAHPSQEMPYYFAYADALLVSLKKSHVFSLTIPSKVQSYFACEKPILGCLDGIGAKTIETAKAGFTSPAQDPSLFAQKVELMYNLSNSERSELGKNARKYFLNEFDREVVYDKLNNLLTFNRQDGK